MAIKAGRFGTVKYGTTDIATAVDVASINTFKLSLATDKIEVTCFNDDNRVYLPGTRDVSGSIGGFFNAADLTIIDATDDDTPGFLVLVPDKNAPLVAFSGPAWLDADIDTDVNGAPKLTGNFSAAGSWTLPASTP